VAELQQEVIGMLQLTFIPGLSRRGATRALIEAVRIASALRSNGYGSDLIREAIRIAQERGCSLVQLTSDRQRQQAHRFYTALGFTDSHIGFEAESDTTLTLRRYRSMPSSS
jgi:ribosomal protein S18 acetylase RimI-like enzyme